MTVMSNTVQGNSSRESNKGFLAHKPKPGPPWGLRTALMALALVFREDRPKQLKIAKAFFLIPVFSWLHLHDELQ